MYHPPVDNPAGALLGGVLDCLTALVDDGQLVLPFPDYPYGEGW
jgi:hypothetical protein